MTQLVPVRLLKYQVRTDGYCSSSSFYNYFVSSELFFLHSTTIMDNADDHVNQCILEVSDVIDPSDKTFPF